MRNALIVVISAVIVASMFAPAVMGANAVASTDQAIECEFPLTVEDATGTEITLEDPPERVVTTSPSAAQIMKEIGAFERVVGLTEFALYLEGADERTLITGDEGVVELETVVELEPDLILAPNTTSSETIEQMRDAGLTVYHFPMEESLDDVFEKTIRIGELVDGCEGAEATTQWMDEELAIVEEAIAGEERPSAMYMFFDFTAGEGTFIEEIIEAAGAENAAGQAGISGYEPISEEVIIDEDPDWIILNSDDPALPDSDAINQTTAAQEEQIVVVQIEHLSQPAPRNVLAITTLVEHFHPEAYEEAKAAAQTDDDTEDIADDADDTGEPDDTDDSDEMSTDDTEEADDGDDAPSVTVDDDADDALPGPGPVVAIGGFLLAAWTIANRRGR